MADTARSCIVLWCSVVSLVACGGESRSDGSASGGADAGTTGGAGNTGVGGTGGTGLGGAGGTGPDGAVGGAGNGCPASVPEQGPGCPSHGINCFYGVKLADGCFGYKMAWCGPGGSWFLSEKTVSCPPFSPCQAGAAYGGTCSLPDQTACVVDDPACCQQVLVCKDGIWGDASPPDPKCAPFCPDTAPLHGTACTANPCVKPPWPNECFYPWQSCPSVQIMAQCSNGKWSVNTPFECP